MNKQVKILKTLSAEDTLLSEGAVLHINKAASPLIRFLRACYLKDPDCIKGNIDFLFSFDGVQPERDDEDILANYERLWKAITNVPPKAKPQCKSENSR